MAQTNNSTVANSVHTFRTRLFFFVGFIHTTMYCVKNSSFTQFIHNIPYQTTNAGTQS